MGYRIFFYVLGMFVLAVGVVFSINSGLGVSPVNSFPYAVSVASGITMGNSVIMIFSFYILVQLILLRKEFKLINLTQLVFSTIFGYFVELAKWIIGDFTFPTYGGSLVMLALSIVIVSVGLTLYLSVDLMPMPTEGMLLVIMNKLNERKNKRKDYSFHDLKTMMDIFSVVMAITISVLGTGSIAGVREGTVISALTIGRVMGVLSKWIQPAVQRKISLPEKG